ncbi:hypothetical protein ACLM5H_18035 [Fredinandcohnia humi]
MWINIIGAILGAIVGAIIGFAIGANVGGNYFSDFVFNGLRGYEAVGQIGAMIVGIIGAGIGAFLSVLVKKQNSKSKT